MATAAAALIEMVPDLTAATSSGAACFWIFSIMTTWLLLRRAALATASRLSSGAGGGALPMASAEGALAGRSGAGSGPAAARARRSATISFLRSASTPRWKLIKLAVLAVGEQGGGVITDWIVELAERNGWYAQSTSVPGVAQRTGATIYYIEMVPDRGGTPVLSLMPAPGDVDIVLAAELMEAGRAMQRGFVTPDRTTLIASSHRTLAVSEKIVPGTGIAEPARSSTRRSNRRNVFWPWTSTGWRRSTAVISRPACSAR